MVYCTRDPFTHVTRDWCRMILDVEQFIVVVFLFLVSSVSCQECRPVPNMPPCVCNMSGSGKTIDLRGLAHHDGTT